MPTARVNGFDMAYEVTGSGPPVVYVHGGSGGFDRFGGFLPPWWVEELFALHFRVVTYNRRGCGRSEMALDGYDIPTFAADLRALLEHLGLGPIALIGDSAGGPIALRLALDHPELVPLLILLRSKADLLVGEQGTAYFSAADIMIELVHRRGGEVLLDFVNALGDAIETFPLAARGLPSAFQQAAAALPPNLRAPLFEIWARIIAPYRGLDLTPELGRLTMPILVVSGEGDSIVPAAGVRRTHAALPNAELRLLPGETHATLGERRSPAMQIVLDWLLARARPGEGHQPAARATNE